MFSELLAQANGVSTVPAVIDFVVGIMRSRFGTYVQVCDGSPIPPEDANPELLCIGFSGTPEEPVVENTRSIQQLKPSPDRESYNLVCMASSWQGNNTDPKLVRDLAYGIVGMVSEELAKDPTLGGRVMQCRVGSDSFGQTQTTKGAVATVRFNIQVEAFTRR